MDDLGPVGLLKTLGDGKVLEDFYDQMTALIHAVRMSHKKGNVTLRVQVSPTGDLELPKVSVRGDVKATIPQLERNSDIFYVNDGDQLSRRNPRQPERPPNTVQMPPVEERVDLDGKMLAAGEKA